MSPEPPDRTILALWRVSGWARDHSPEWPVHHQGQHSQEIGRISFTRYRGFDTCTWQSSVEAHSGGQQLLGQDTTRKEHNEKHYSIVRHECSGCVEHARTHLLSGLRTPIPIPLLLESDEEPKHLQFTTCCLQAT